MSNTFGWFFLYLGYFAEKLRTPKLRKLLNYIHFFEKRSFLIFLKLNWFLV